MLCVGFSLVGASGSYAPVAVHGLIVVASLVAEHRLWSAPASHGEAVTVARRLGCPAACGTFQDQESNPCPLHRQVDF